MLWEIRGSLCGKGGARFQGFYLSDRKDGCPLLRWRGQRGVGLRERNGSSLWCGMGVQVETGCVREFRAEASAGGPQRTEDLGGIQSARE